MEELIIDWALADRLAGNSHERAKEILNLLIELLPEHRHDISTAYQEKNWPILERALHKLIGALCYCGTPRLTATAKKLHQSIKIKTARQSSREEYFHALLSEINEVIRAAST
ncbi:MAG: hypothetical protein A2103_03505 [Gammaproteobacteria bacterium GWF2_41_13]|nr:MAG: hypothetical protein A2103_03505 [Gammaproteobacteria bacterium GWF2_41_13]